MGARSRLAERHQIPAIIRLTRPRRRRPEKHELPPRFWPLPTLPASPGKFRPSKPRRTAARVNRNAARREPPRNGARACAARLKRAARRRRRLPPAHPRKSARPFSRARTTAGLSQNDLASKLKAAQQNVQRLEKGGSTPPTNTLLVLRRRPDISS